MPLLTNHDDASQFHGSLLLDIRSSIGDDQKGDKPVYIYIYIYIYKYIYIYIFKYIYIYISEVWQYIFFETYVVKIERGCYVKT